VIEGGRSDRGSSHTDVRVDPFSMLAVLAVMAVVLLVLVVRGVQGAPPAEDWGSLTGGSVEVAPRSISGAAELPAATFTVSADDTWSSIAARVAPDRDPVEVARWLAMQNGGYQLVPGQVLDISPQP
jgi:hypothetical protein